MLVEAPALSTPSGLPPQPQAKLSLFQTVQKPTEHHSAVQTHKKALFTEYLYSEMLLSGPLLIFFQSRSAGFFMQCPQLIMNANKDAKNNACHVAQAQKMFMIIIMIILFPRIS